MSMALMYFEKRLNEVKKDKKFPFEIEDIFADSNIKDSATFTLNIKRKNPSTPPIW